MGKSFERLKYIFLIVLFLLSVASCGKHHEESVVDNSSYRITMGDDYMTYRKDKTRKVIKEADMTFTLDLLPMDIDGNGEIRNIFLVYNDYNPGHAITQLSLGRSTDEREAKKLSTIIDMANGSGPDILVVNRERLRELSKKNLLLPLTEIYSEDTLRALVPAVIDSGTADGSFYGLTPCIDEIRTCLVPKDVYGEKTWNIDAVLKLRSDKPEIERTFVSYYDKKDSAWWWTCLGIYNCDGEGSRYIDYENKSCDFDSTDFMMLLECAAGDSKSFLTPDDFGADKEKVLAHMSWYHSSADILKALAEKKAEYNIVGFPRESGGGNYLIPDYFFVVNKNGKHLDEAAEFMNFIVSPECQNALSSGISVRLDAVDSYMEKNNEGLWITGKMIGKDYWSDRYIFVTAYEVDTVNLEEEYESFMYDCFSAPRYDAEIREILYEETEHLFAAGGDVNAVAEKIQERVQKYLDEGNPE